MTTISFYNISKSFPVPKSLKRKKVLHDLTLTINKGEIFGFLGPNGAGKSTSIKLLLGLIRADKGRLQINGQTITSDPLYRQQIGYLPEAPFFYENLNAIEILYFCGRANGMSKQEINEKADGLLERLNLLHAKKTQIKTFSKGMKQRLGLAAAILHDPDIFIFDEPMSGLDPMGRHLVTDVILDLRAAGKTVFFSSHILSDVEKLCNRISILNHGHLIYCGPTEIFITKNSSLEESFMNCITYDNRKNHA